MLIVYFYTNHFLLSYIFLPYLLKNTLEIQSTIEGAKKLIKIKTNQVL